MTESYLFFKSLHILGVILLLGNLIVTAWWKLMANRTKNPSIIAFASYKKFNIRLPLRVMLNNMKAFQE